LKEEGDQNDGDSESKDKSQSDFEKELTWCIGQVKLGLKHNQVTKEQLKDSMQLLSVLESKTAPLIKKRHLMKVCFGNYRALMKTMPIPA